ncbi:MAG: glycoside hydrolase family 2 protein [Acidobacteria bacterium]|nr:glycoside hydrolase family 2 protein [Acidobacteriota bacterium]
MRNFRLCRTALLSVTVCGVLAASATEIRIGGERRIRLTEDWRFLKGDAPGAEAPAFDDSSWRALNLPHDWAIEGPFDPKYNPHTGGLAISGTGWYRKHFVIPASARGKQFVLQIDGAMANATVWLNGAEVGARPYGYESWAVNLTRHIRIGEENVLAVRLTPEDRSSRWYPGAGIYRNVWLIVSGPARVAQWGTYVTTPAVTDAKATVSVLTTVENRATHAAKIALDTALVDAAGKRVGGGINEFDLPAGDSKTVETRIEVANPRRWDMDSPYLYRALSTVRSGGEISDRYETPFGIRTIEFTRARGFVLNGKPRRFQGVCMHHDLGALGAAINRRALERQLEILKSMGVNAIRTSHNPPAPELLELADRMGMVVMDEAFDMWAIPKVPNGLSKHWKEWSETDLREFVRRDRNHPSVVMWSIGNEIPEQGRPDGAKTAQRLTDICHEEDPTRPTTSAFNSPDAAIRNHLDKAVDIPGLNYKPLLYARFLREHPEWKALVGTETASTVSSRGVYHLPIEKYEKHPSHELTSYDVIVPAWADLPDVEFDAQEKNPEVMGEFVWTGFDYLGEPTPYFGGMRGGDNAADWPARSSYFGIVDLAGFPKDRFYLYQSVWTKKPMVHILPHWNWAGMEGKPIPVMAYTNADEVELFLNGKSLGRKKHFGEPVALPVAANISPDRKFLSKYRLMWQVPYAPGTLKAVAYQGGKAVATQEIKTAGAPARVVLAPDRAAIASDGDDLSFVTVRIEDKDGNPCPTADNLVNFKIDGPGTIAGVDNGNAATTESFQADHRKAFSGMALLILRGEKDKPGRVRITASSDGLKAGEIVVTTKK